MNLLTHHRYYCSTANYYTNKENAKYSNWADFYSDWKDVDLDYNLVFRWDIKEYEEDRTGLYMEVFFILQRKGIFRPVRIESIQESDFPEIEQFLLPHWEYLNEIWQPLSLTPTPQP